MDQSSSFDLAEAMAEAGAMEAASTLLAARKAAKEETWLAQVGIMRSALLILDRLGYRVVPKIPVE